MQAIPLGAAALTAGLAALLPLPAWALERLYINGSILTMAGERPSYVEALGVENGRIVFTGPRQRGLALRTATTRIIDLQGKALLPGFIDGHSHYINSLLVANQCKLYAPPAGPGKDVPSILAALKTCASERQLNKGELLIGYGYVVAPLDQLFMLWSAVNRLSRSGETIGPDQRVSPYEGLKAMTAWAAEQYGEQASKGTLEVGKLADLVILDRDPLQVAPIAIKEIKVAETIKEGVTIYPQPAGGLRPIAAAPSTKTYSWTAHSCDMDAINQAAGREWTLVSLLGQPVSTARPPTLRAAAGRLSIFGGINRLNGSVALVRDQVVIGELISTRMAGPPELMALEERFAATLRTVNRFHVHGSRLELLRD
jgi:heat shock protein HslJ